MVTALEEFQALGVDFVSLGESVDTSTPMGKMIFTVLGAVAELERSLSAVPEACRRAIAGDYGPAGLCRLPTISGIHPLVRATRHGP